MSREVVSPDAAPDESLSVWMTESRQQLREDNRRIKQQQKQQEECFATLPLGGQDKLRARLKAEMNRDYNDFLSKQKTVRRAAGRDSVHSQATVGDITEKHSKIPIPSNRHGDQFPDRKRGQGTELGRDVRDVERREPMGPAPLAPRYDPLEELRLRRYFEDQLYSGARHGYYAYPPPPPPPPPPPSLLPPEAYPHNLYVNYYREMDRVWGPERDMRRSPPPQREKRVTFPQEWPEEAELYGWAQPGRRSEMKMREVERDEGRGERRGRSESPLNRSRSAPPEKNERGPVGFMDGFGSGNRGREEERRRREEYARELKEQIRSKQINQSFVLEGKRSLSTSRPPTPPQLYDSPPHKQRSRDPLDYYKSAGQPDYFSPPDNNTTASNAGTELSNASNETGQTPQARKESYRRVLEQQMEEDRNRKAQVQRQRTKYRDEPVEEWSPWGKGGGGAPLKDSSGRVVADLKVLNKANQAREKTGSSPKLEALADICMRKTNLSPVQKAMDAVLSPETASPSPSKKEPALTPQQEYREFLRQQVEEKKARRLAEEAQRREEDRREAERLENERLKLQEDYQREVIKQREKEEAIRQKNEELKRAAEERRKAPSSPERGRGHRREKSVPSSENSPIRTLEPRNISPPIPTLRNKLTSDPAPSPQQALRPDMREMSPSPSLRRHTQELSPPVPSLRRRTHDLSPPDVPIRTSETVDLVRTDIPLSPLLPSTESSLSLHQSEAVRQLTDMKQQLRHENDRVKQQLEISQEAFLEADLDRRHAAQDAQQQQPIPKISKAAKPPFKIKKTSVPPKAPGEQASRAERRTVGFHLQNTQPNSKAYHREYEPLLKGRGGTPPAQSRPDSTGSDVSISTLDIETLALRNDSRMKRLESLLRSNQDFEDRKTSPESVINQLLQRAPVRRNKRPSNRPALDEFSL